MGAGHGHGHGCHADHHRGEYTARQRADLDLVLAFLGIWLLSSLLIPQDVPIVAASIISAIVIAVGEWFFHIYMKRRVLHQAEGF